MKKMLFLPLIALISLPLFAEDIPGQQLFSYFSSNCRTQGEWTRAALADSIALIEAFKNISQDEDCRSVGGAVAQLGLLNQQLETYDKTNETQTKIAELNSQEQELLIQLSATSDLDTLAAINAQLRDLQVLRAGLIGREKSEAELSAADKTKTLSSVVQIANTAFSQIAANQKCLSKHPGLVNTATSIMASVGATTAVVNPALGLGLTAGAEFLGQTVEGVRKIYSKRAIRKMADTTLALEGHKCALETMSDRWCQMRDAEAFFAFKDQQRRIPHRTDLGYAVKLNQKELPVLIEWLNRIRSGVTPTTTADASRQNAVFARETFIRSAEASGLGLIEETRMVYESADTAPEKRAVIRSLVNSLLNEQSDSHVKNPFYEIYTHSYAPFYLLGVNDDASIRNTEGNYYDLNNWPGFAGYNPDLDQLKVQFTNWVSAARKRVNQELTQVLQPDALQTLTLAFDRNGNRWKISPIESLRRLIDFIEMNRPRAADRAFRKLYESTLEKLKEIHSATASAVITDPSYLDGNTETVERIYDLAQLRYGTVVIEARLEMIIRLALLELLENSPQQDQIFAAQLLAAERFTDTLTRLNEYIRADIKRAQPYTIANLNTFIEVFGHNINRMIIRLYKEERNSSGTVARAKRYSRTELCFLLLSVPDARDHVDVRYCEGLQMRSLYLGGPDSIVLSAKTFVLDMNERACEYREFFRKNRIFETWGIK